MTKAIPGVLMLPESTLNDHASSSHIRFIACATTDHFATASNADTALWSLRERTCVCRFQSPFDGNWRMALLDGPRLAAAALEGGVTFFDDAGRVLWERDDLVHSQALWPVVVRGRSAIAACFDEARVQVLDADDGKTIVTMPASRRTWQLDPSWIVCLKSKEIARYDFGSARTGWRIRLRTPTVLNAALSPEAVIFSEVQGAVRCVSHAGERLWEWQPPAGSHVAVVAWERSRSLWACVVSPYHFEPKEVVLLDVRGDVVSGYTLGKLDQVEFFRDGSHVVSSDGVVRVTATGAVAWAFGVADVRAGALA